MMIGLCESSNSLLSNSIRIFLEFGRFLIDEVPSTALFRAEAIQAYIKHFNKVDIGLLLVAYYLDPNHRAQFLTAEAVRRIRTKILAILLEMGKSTTIIETLVEELSKYLSKMKKLREYIVDIHKWWLNEKDLPLLRAVGLRFARCHSSSANTERTFSGLNRIITYDRNRIGIRTAYELMSIRIAVKSGQEVTRRIKKKPSPESPENVFLSNDLMNEGTEDSQEFDPTVDVDLFFQSFAYSKFSELINFASFPTDSAREWVPTSPEQGVTYSQIADRLIDLYESESRNRL